MRSEVGVSSQHEQPFDRAEINILQQGNLQKERYNFAKFFRTQGVESMKCPGIPRYSYQRVHLTTVVLRYTGPASNMILPMRFLGFTFCIIHQLIPSISS